MENEKIIKAIRGGADRLEMLNKLYTQNRGLILKTARKYAPFADIQDLMQEGYFAVENAVRAFDETRGANFATYLIFHLKAVFSRFLSQNCAVSISTHDFEKVLKCKRLLGAGYSESEIQAALGLTVEQFRQLETMSKQLTCTSLDKPLDDTDGEPLYITDIIPDDRAAAVYEDIERLDELNALNKALDCLPDELRVIIRERHFENLNFYEIGERHGYNYDRARRLHGKAIAELRRNNSLKAAYFG